jgi:hypothetical protein
MMTSKILAFRVPLLLLCFLSQAKAEDCAHVYADVLNRCVLINDCDEFGDQCRVRCGQTAKNGYNFCASRQQQPPIPQGGCPPGCSQGPTTCECAFR